MQSTNTNTSPARKFTREEREAFLAQKNLQRQERLVTAGYPEQIAKNIVAYAKQHRGYGPTDGRHGGDWLCSALCGIVYGLKYKIDTFGENEVMLMNGNCLAFLDGVACFYKGEQVAVEKGIAESIDDIIEAYTSPRTTEGRIMYTLAHRCEPLDESKTGRKDFGPGGKAERMHYLCEAIVDLLVTNKDTFAAFYHEDAMEDPNNVRKCKACGSVLVRNKRGFYDCHNASCAECRDENGYKVNDNKRHNDRPARRDDEAAPVRDTRPRRQFNNADRAKFDPSKYKKSGGKKRTFASSGAFTNSSSFDNLGFDESGNLVLNK